VILQSLVLAVLRRRDEIPDKTLDLLIPLVVFDAIDQQGPTNHLHVLLIQVPLEPPVGQDVFPASPAGTAGTQTELDLMISEVSSNLNDSTIKYCCATTDLASTSLQQLALGHSPASSLNRGVLPHIMGAERGAERGRGLPRTK